MAFALFSVSKPVMSPFLYVPLSTALVLYLFRKYLESTWGHYYSTSSLKGQTFLVTGANNGTGKEVTKQLLQRHATVIMACRSVKAAGDALADIRKEVSTGEAIIHQLDLSSLDSVRSFAAEILKTYSRIDVLINNAGVFVPIDSTQKTKEGFELTFGVNHLGHFLMTHLLLSKLKESKPSRIVIVSSTLFELGNIDLNDLNLDKVRALGLKYRVSPCYSTSKLANFYHARGLAERLKSEGVDVRAVSPGPTLTGLMRNSGIKWYLLPAYLPMAFLRMRSVSQGAQAIMYAATEKNLPGKSGDFYFNCRQYTPKMILDSNLQEELWRKSEQLVGIRS